MPAEGRALLLLVPSEQEAMLQALEAAKVPVKAIKMNPGKQQPITGALQALLSKDSALKVIPCTLLDGSDLCTVLVVVIVFVCS